MFACPLFALFAFFSAEELLGSVAPCSVCTCCHNNEMSHSGRTAQNKPNLAGVKCAKRSQFRRAGRPAEYPAFHYSIIPPSRSEAYCAKRTQFLGVRACLEAELRKTKPNLGRMGHLGDTVPGRGQSCKTNPIWPRTGKQGHGWSKSCETNPISGQPGAGDARLCKTNPIWLVGRRPGGANAQNEPNSGPAGRDTAWGTRDERAKQTQFPSGAAWGEAPEAWDARQMRKTNPIWDEFQV